MPATCSTIELIAMNALNAWPYRHRVPMQHPPCACVITLWYSDLQFWQTRSRPPMSVKYDQMQWQHNPIAGHRER